MLLSIEKVHKDVTLGLWRMEESPEQLYNSYPFLLVYREMIDDLYGCDTRKLEFLTARVLLFMMTKDDSLQVTHNAEGRPILSNGSNISISHTQGFLSLILSSTIDVGVDIEYFSTRVSRIADKFIRSDENANDVTSQLIHWSAKETIFKLFSKDKLQYFDMRLENLKCLHEGSVYVENIKDRNSVLVFYRVTDDYVLTYSWFHSSVKLM
jgi:phosphopantetheinyl transferase